MVNNTEFADRIQTVLEFYDLTASSFAEKIGVQRSSISHILSGRNKPSLDFILKMIEAFPEVPLAWLLLNKGGFPTTSKNLNSLGSEKEKEKSDLFSQFDNQTVNTPVKAQEPGEVKQKPFPPENLTNNTSAIERVIIFFKDGSFKDYHN